MQEQTTGTVETLIDAPAVRVYGGITRLPYWLGTIGLMVLNFMMGMAARGAPPLAMLGILVVIVGSFILMAQRLKNIGMNPWLCLLGIIPIVNLFVSIPCAAYPTGWSDTRKLDTAGKVIIWILVASVALILIALVAGVARR